MSLKDTLFFKFISHFWWFVIPIVLLVIYTKLRKFYKGEKKKRKVEWCLLEIMPPKEIHKSPNAMEQVFATANEIYPCASFEIVGRAGAIHFYIRTPKKFRNLIESAVYAQYGEAEIRSISEENDYINQFSSSLPDEIYDVWGTEFLLKKDDGYPIKTYGSFVEGNSKKIEQIVDPIAGITETMSNLKSSEAIWLQILTKPIDNKKWNKKAEKLIKNILEDKKEESKMANFFSAIGDGLSEFIVNLFQAMYTPPTWGEEGDKKYKDKKEVSSGKRKIVEAIGEKASKIGFKTNVRFVYIDRRDAFTQLNIFSVIGSFHQFSTNNLNAFEQNKDVKTEVKSIFKKQKNESRKRRIFSNYISKNFSKRTLILNVEELATLYHFPSTEVKSPNLRRVSTRRGSPPENLPTE